MVAALASPLCAQDKLEGEFDIKFPYPLLGRDSFPTVKEIAQIAKEAEAKPRVVLLFSIYPDPADRGRPPDVPAKDRNDYYAPSWSPDGRALSFLRADIKSRTSKIMLLPSTSAAKPITVLDGKDSYDYMLSWALGKQNGADPASSTNFVFSSTAGPDENLDVYLCAVTQNPVGMKGPVRLTKGKVLRRYPTLFQREKNSNLLFCDGPVVKEIGLAADLSSLLAPSSGDSVVGEALSLGYGNYPTWAPDGSAVAYAKQKGEAEGHTLYDLYLRRATGLEHPLAADPEYRVRTPAWSPDGKRVAYYAAKGQSGWGLFVVDAQGISPLSREIAPNVATEDNFDFVSPAWLSSGKGLIYFVRTAQAEAGGHYPLRWTFLDKEGGEIEYPPGLTTANDLAVSPERGVLEAAFVATRRLAQDVYVMIVTEPGER